MRSSIVLALLLVFAGCTSDQEKAERDLERAEKQLEHAREQVAEAQDKARDHLDEARDRLREAREELDDVRHGWSEDARDEAERALEDAGVGQAIGAVFEEVGRALQGDTSVQPVDAKDLLSLLPEDIAGFERKNTSRDNTSALGIRLSHVRGDYDGSDGADMTIALVDLGTLHDAASAALETLDLHVDREDRHERQQTTEFDGFPGHIKISEWGRTQRVEATAFVGERFVVHIEADGDDADEELVERVFDRIGLRRLARLD